MEALDRVRGWDSDFEEIDDVLDDSFFTEDDDMEDVEDDDFHEMWSFTDHILHNFGAFMLLILKSF